ncbi:hypothetical protein [Leucobacter sp. W1153]|uniref:hypothetical protein n=1 Tax=unclassified Leucobacter TaxID=2621730 RepID=UPI003F2A4BC9
MDAPELVDAPELDDPPLAAPGELAPLELPLAPEELDAFDELEDVPDSEPAPPPARESLR